MPYIIVSLEGQATAGGYLKIDGGGQIALSDDLMIGVSEGRHYLEFSSQSSGQRGLSKLNAAVGNYNMAAWSERNSVDGKITEDFPENSVMLFTVISDGAGHILDLPTYNMKVLSDDAYSDMTKEYNERIETANKEARATAGTEFLLCFFLGGLGVHKFYRKNMGAGILYLFTGGVFGIGWLLDTVKLLFAWIKSRK